MLQNLGHVATVGRPLSRSSSRGGGESPAVKPGGTVLSVAPLMGTEPDCDPTHAQWLHVHVRPPVRALLKVRDPDIRSELAASGFRTCRLCSLSLL